MATYRYTTCPHCGHKETTVYHGTMTRIASPFVKCKHCEQVVADSLNREWAMLDKKRRWFYIVDARCILGGIFGGILLSVFIERAIHNDVTPLGIVFMIFLIPGLISLFGYIRYNSEGARNPVKESIARMEDPIYSSLIKRHYDVFDNDFYPFRD